ncbi:FadR/GntR family transcriptional regulator [Rathayibacter soli]|uniref:FadR/GntR family transcriptional regulator n=1 Tax=Rathayibacter soli TaxID=3144168 RepID=UPI0027E585C4|nr:FCD domain-containing protein [Glaciibacter superstes]
MTPDAALGSPAPPAGSPPSATAPSGSAPSGSARAWETVLQSIEAALLDGRLRPGDHLPPERALASELGVGRSSVREAVRVLEVLGLIRTATGSGPSAGAIIVATPSGGMSALMRLQVAAQGFAVEDVVATRLLLETSIVSDLASAAAAASAATAASARLRHVARDAPLEVAQGDEAGAHDAAHRTYHHAASRRPTLTPATQLLDAMDSLALTEAEFLALDARFHVALAEASGNSVIAAMMEGLRNSIESYVLAAVPNLPSWARTSARLREEHRGILQAIAGGDPADAAARVRAHITGYYAESALTNQPTSEGTHDG